MSIYPDITDSTKRNKHKKYNLGGPRVICRLVDNEKYAFCRNRQKFQDCTASKNKQTKLYSKESRCTFVRQEVQESPLIHSLASRGFCYLWSTKVYKY